MRSPARVLNSLTKHSQTTEYRFERLYRILFNEEMYYLAYQRIYAKPGNMTQGADGETIDRMSLPRIEKLILSLKDESYSPQPSRRVHIPKKNGKTRPLGVPSFDDKLVQEVVPFVQSICPVLSDAYNMLAGTPISGFQPDNPSRETTRCRPHLLAGKHT